MRVCRVGALAAVLLVPGVAPAVEPASPPAVKPTEAPKPAPPTEAEMKRWIEELGADKYETRAAAMKRLETAGEAAFPLLEKTQADNPEVRSRIEDLLSGPPTGFDEGNAPSLLKTLVTLEMVGRAQDVDRNGVADYWVRDVAALYCLRDVEGKPVALSTLQVALADAAPAREYPELRGGRKPRRGYVVRVFKTDQDGKPYADPALPPPAAAGAPPGACTNGSRFGFAAYPLRYGKDGKLTFFVCEEGVIWRKDLGPGAAGLDANPQGDKRFGTLQGWWFQFDG